MKNIRFIHIVAMSSVFVLSGCFSEDVPSDGYDSSLHKKTAGAAVYSSFEKLCGAKRIDEYRQSFINKMKRERSLTAEAENKIKAVFANTDTSVASRFSNPAAKKTQCENYPANQAIIDRGIAGDFSGQI